MGRRLGGRARRSPGHPRCAARRRRTRASLARSARRRRGCGPRRRWPHPRAPGAPYGAAVTPAEDSRMTSGTVYLVGAGPGDPKLITVRGAEVLGQAEVVVYDRLVSPALLKQAPPAAERVYVGKEPGRSAMKQEDIDSLIVRRALAGGRVGRLQGGDAFGCGRGGAEAWA